jgi:hypothetical protein
LVVDFRNGSDFSISTVGLGDSGFCARAEQVAKVMDNKASKAGRRLDVFCFIAALSCHPADTGE